MTLLELAHALAEFATDSDQPPREGWDEHTRRWATLVALAEKELQAVAPAAFCTAQEWDNRIDCAITTEEGVVGEMLALTELSVERLHQAGLRLSRKAAGEVVELVTPLQPPLYIGGPLTNVR